MRVRIGGKAYDAKVASSGAGPVWFKEKVADRTCIIEKVDSKENNSDIGTKRVPKFIFEYLMIKDKYLISLNTHV